MELRMPSSDFLWNCPLNQLAAGDTRGAWPMNGIFVKGAITALG